MSDNKKGPCFECSRHGEDIHCHSTCEAYIDWEALRKAEKAYIRSNKKKANLIYDFKKDSVTRAHKRKGKW